MGTAYGLCPSYNPSPHRKLGKAKRAPRSLANHHSITSTGIPSFNTPSLSWIRFCPKKTLLPCLR